MPTVPSIPVQVCLWYAVVYNAWCHHTKMIATAVTLSEVNFVTGHALFKVRVWRSQIPVHLTFSAGRQRPSSQASLGTSDNPKCPRAREFHSQCPLFGPLTRLQIFLAPCTFMPEIAVPCILASTGLYLVADSAFKSNADDAQVAEEFDFAQLSVVNFLLDVPGFVCGTYDRFLVCALSCKS